MRRRPPSPLARRPSRSGHLEQPLGVEISRFTAVSSTTHLLLAGQFLHWHVGQAAQSSRSPGSRHGHQPGVPDVADDGRGPRGHQVEDAPRSQRKTGRPGIHSETRPGEGRSGTRGDCVEAAGGSSRTSTFRRQSWHRPYALPPYRPSRLSPITTDGRAMIHGRPLAMTVRSASRFERVYSVGSSTASACGVSEIGPAA